MYLTAYGPGSFVIFLCAAMMLASTIVSPATTAPSWPAASARDGDRSSAAAGAAVAGRAGVTAARALYPYLAALRDPAADGLYRSLCRHCHANPFFCGDMLRLCVLRSRMRRS